MTKDKKENEVKDFGSVPLSESNVSLRLADIQRRCSELLTEEDDLGGLSLEEDATSPKDNSNPYDRG